MDDLMLLAAIAAGTAAVLIFVSILLVGTRRSAERNFAESAEPHRNRADDVCGICFGIISKEDVIAKCGCGQAFHDTCAGPTGACPYCMTPYDGFVKETPDCIICPSCGNDVVGNVCGCGTVVCRDGTFTCKCGNTLDVNDPVCGKCGTEYDVCRGRSER